MSACATPWAIPPWRWPSTSSGLRITPQSSTHTIRTSRTLPVSVSTSTTATCAPTGQVGDGGLKSSSIARQGGGRTEGRGRRRRLKPPPQRELGEPVAGVERLRELPPRDALARHAGDVEDAALGVELDVGRAGLELVGDDILGLLEDLDRRAADRRAAG